MKTTAPRERISKTPATHQAARKHLRQQVINSGVSNAILNSLFFYLFNTDMGVITYESVFTDTLITCGFVACLVTWPTSFFTRKAVRAGLPPIERTRLIDRLPKKWPLLWLTLWLLSAHMAGLQVLRNQRDRIPADADREVRFDGVAGRRAGRAGRGKISAARRGRDAAGRIATRAMSMEKK